MTKKEAKIIALRGFAALEEIAIEKVVITDLRDYDLLNAAFNDVAHELLAKANKIEKRTK